MFPVWGELQIKKTDYRCYMVTLSSLAQTESLWPFDKIQIPYKHLERKYHIVYNYI